MMLVCLEHHEAIAGSEPAAAGVGDQPIALRKEVTFPRFIRTDHIAGGSFDISPLGARPSDRAEARSIHLVSNATFVIWVILSKVTTIVRHCAARRRVTGFDPNRSIANDRCAVIETPLSLNSAMRFNIL
jgi:hypothetical protein